MCTENYRLLYFPCCIANTLNIYLHFSGVQLRCFVLVLAKVKSYLAAVVYNYSIPFHFFHLHLLPHSCLQHFPVSPNISVLISHPPTKCGLRPLYVVIFLLTVFHFFCLVLHCVSGVTSVVLPYGRWHHAVLPQGRTTDGMLGGVCVRPSVHTPPTSSHVPHEGGNVLWGVLGSGSAAGVGASAGPHSL